MDEFSTFIRTIIPVDETELNIIRSKCRSKTVPKGNLVLKKGHIARQYYFIVSGGLRFYYENENGEITTWVVFENEFLTEISSLNPQKPTRFNIIAIAYTELIILDQKDMEFLYAHVPVWNEFSRKIWEETTIRMIDQILKFQTLTAEERYLEFMNNSEMVKKIPTKQLASVLGITPNALSRIRKMYVKEFTTRW